MNKELAMEMCKELIRRGLHKKITWSSGGRVNVLDRDLLSIMKKAGCVYLGFGAESGDNEILKIIKKGITTEEMEKVFKLCQEIGIKTEANFILGHPYETEDTILKTIEFAKKLKADHATFAILVPFPGTEVRAMAEKGIGEPKENSLVSVIIPTKNSEETIGICLESVKKQSYPNIEVIVVDNFSEDRTKEIAEKYGARVFENNAIRSAARNFGAKNANGVFLFHIDSDMELTPKVVDECVNKTQNGFDGVIVPEISVGEGFWTKCKALERSCYIGDNTIEAARFFKKEVFERVNGYSESLEFGEDWDLHQRVKNNGCNISRINALIKHHEGKISLWKLMKKKYHYGKTLDNYVKKNKDVARKQLTLFRPAYFRNWKTLVRDPVHTVGFMFMKVCEFGAAGVGWFWSLVRI